MWFGHLFWFGLARYWCSSGPHGFLGNFSSLALALSQALPLSSPYVLSLSQLPLTAPHCKPRRLCLSGYYSLHINTRIKVRGVLESSHH